MGDITNNFSRSEFACKCGCGNDGIDPKLVEGVQQIRDILGTPFSPNSACRCWAHNKSVGGSPQSQHLCNRACDIPVPDGMESVDLANIADTIPQFKNGGIGIYRTFVHVDVRGYKARWSRT